MKTLTAVLKGLFSPRPAAQPVAKPAPTPAQLFQPTKVERVDIIKASEQLRLTAYMPTKNDVWTIGWGHTRTAKAGMRITVTEAERLLQRDLAWVRVAIARNVKVALTQPQYDALASLIFNIGEGNFARSTVLRRLNASDYVGAANAFTMWNKQRSRKTGKMVVLRGLTRRRAEERALFLEGTQ